MREALFMGRLTAAATHDLQNVLATIRESSGLMEDLLAMGAENFPHAERFQKGLKVLSEQVERGMNLAEELNYCAHAPEAVATGAEINEAMRSLIGLSRRLAARGRVKLALCPGRGGLRTSLRGLEAMALAGLALECALPGMAQNSTLSIFVEEQGGLGVVRLSGPGFEECGRAPAFAELKALAKSLGAGLSAGPQGQGLALALPRPAA